jgi:3-(3-hydroxy-phenyl)propionate hydroxylase
VELHGGAQVLLDDMLGNAFALLALPGFDAAPVRADFESTGLRFKCLTVIPHSDDFLQPATPQGTMVRDVGDSLEKIIRSAGAAAVILRPDRYVLVYLGRHDSHGADGVRQLLMRYAARRTETEPA